MIERERLVAVRCFYEVFKCLSPQKERMNEEKQRCTTVQGLKKNKSGFLEKKIKFVKHFSKKIANWSHLRILRK